MVMKFQNSNGGNNMCKRLILFNVSVVIFAILFLGFFQKVEARHLKLYGMQRPEKGLHG